MALKISEEAAVQMPMKTVASLITLVAIGTWAYFGIIETQNKIQTTERAVQALIIGLALVLILLVGCSYNMVPHETKIEYGTTETDSKNDKLQQKQSVTQTWKWKQHD